ncbi:MAG: LLM class flavin-dependent oxidoreductase [Actinomycetota bacterium]|jgi:alkanesulfonate monooxygenase SsuD/methylene tetrahydromethanopterin reductase-like flavin-dependent oxidoreductase (luciferase family)|nr:LLM class flavin-dependent oxidoreductase [Actinomycetota bacterium]
MRVGVSLSSTHQVEHHPDGARRMIERAAAAHRAGLDHLGVGDHHSSEVPYYQNVPMLGRLLAEWTERPAGALFLLPLWHPVLLAEQIGTLASIHDGPFIVQTGLGGRPAEFAAMGKKVRRRVGDFEEIFRIVVALLDGETVSSQRFDISNAAIAPRPSQRVEWWMGAGVDAGLERAARLGAAWYASPGLSFATGREMAARFREHHASHGRAGGGGEARLVLRQDAVVAATTAEAVELARPIVERGYRGIDPADLAVGSVEDVAERFAAWLDAGFTDISVRQMSIPQSAALESLALLGAVREAVR